MKQSYLQDIEKFTQDIEKMQPNMKALDLYEEVKNRLKENSENYTTAKVLCFLHA